MSRGLKVKGEEVGEKSSDFSPVRLQSNSNSSEGSEGTKREERDVLLNPVTSSPLGLNSSAVKRRGYMYLREDADRLELEARMEEAGMRVLVHKLTA